MGEILKMPKLSEKDILRFWSNVKLMPDDNLCWEWQTYKTQKGYGRIHISKNMILSHRISYFLFYKKDPIGLCVLHHCDNPSCVNPKHLFLGTNDDNVRDCILKNRHARGMRSGVHTQPHTRAFGLRNGRHTKPECTVIPKGEKHGMAKLDAAKINEIKELYKGGGITQRQVAKLYGVKQTAIWNILTNRTWKHLLPAQIIVPKINYAFGYINA